MMRNFIVFTFMCLTLLCKTTVCQAGAITSDSCDLIITLSGNEIRSKVFEVGEVEIKYRKCDFQTGPLYTIKKSDVFMIKYSNGSKDVFEKKESNASDDKDTEKQNPSMPEQNKIKVTIFYPGKKMLVGKAMFDVYWDGVFVGEMSFKKGGQVEVYTSEGPHRLKIRTMEYHTEVKNENKDSHYVRLRYDVSLGEVLIDKKK